MFLELSKMILLILNVMQVLDNNNHLVTNFLFSLGHMKVISISQSRWVRV